MNRYSPSKIQTFEQCKLKFKLHYLDKIEVPEPISYPANFGSLVHEIAEKYDGSNLRKLIKLVRNYELNEEYRQLIAPVVKNVVKFLEKYSKYDFEPEQEFTLKNDRAWLYGIIDRIMYINEDIVFVDYKTGKSTNKEKYIFQMNLYNLMISKKHNKDPRNVKCIIYFPRQGIEEKILFSKTKAQIFEAKLYRTIDNIESNIDWSHTESGLCPWCKYSNTVHCPIKVEKRQ